MIADATDVYKWVSDNIGPKIILAGSSAGGYLAMTVSALAEYPPIATLLIYGLLDFTDTRYTKTGRSVFGGPLINTAPVLAQFETAKKDGSVLSGYEYPKNPSIDQRLAFVAAMHQDAIIPDLLTGIHGLSERISKSGSAAIPGEFHMLFVQSFALNANVPPTVLIHGEDDIAVFPNQSIQMSQRLKELGVQTHLEIVPGASHGFDVSDGNIDVESGTDPKPYFVYLKRVLLALDSFLSE